MDRPSIDQAVLQMLDRSAALLLDVVRAGGRDDYEHLRSHHHATIRRVIRHGYLIEPNWRRYEITDAGRRVCER